MSADSNAPDPTALCRRRVAVPGVGRWTCNRLAGHDGNCSALIGGAQ